MRFDRLLILVLTICLGCSLGENLSQHTKLRPSGYEHEVVEALRRVSEGTDPMMSLGLAYCSREGAPLCKTTPKGLIDSQLFKTAQKQDVIIDGSGVGKDVECKVLGPTSDFLMLPDGNCVGNPRAVDNHCGDQFKANNIKDSDIWR